jgi:methionyl-tRNA formyltransferase
MGEGVGTILTREGHIACGGDTVLQLIKIQPEGGKAMDFAAAVNGGHIRAGENFA